MTTGDVKGACRPVARPNSLIFTLYGDFVQGNRLSIRSLVRLMAGFGLSEQAVRQAISRMSRQGWLAASKDGNRAYYALTPAGLKRVQAISPRIYEPAAEWDGRWRLLTYSIPEHNRERRDRLRKDLTVLGLAPLSASTWISPRDVFSEVRELIEINELGQHIDLFLADHAGPSTDRELLEKNWDLPALASAYREFLNYYEPRLSAARADSLFSDEQAFVERLWLVQDFRRFVYLDPGLPSALLPAHWPGSAASSVFREYYAVISSKALRFFEAQLR